MHPIHWWWNPATESVKASDILGLVISYRFPWWFQLEAVTQGQIRLHIFEDIELHWRNCCHCLCILRRRTIYNDAENALMITLMSFRVMTGKRELTKTHEITYLDGIVVVAENLVVAATRVFGKRASVRIIWNIEIRVVKTYCFHLGLCESHYIILNLRKFQLKEKRSEFLKNPQNYGGMAIY